MRARDAVTNAVRRASCLALITWMLATGATAELNPKEEAVAPSENDRRVDYVEFQTTDIEKTKIFYSEVFGWRFTDYGPSYTSFADGRLAGGFDATVEPSKGGPLVIIYAANLEELEAQVRENGGSISKETFEFPGGRRFHFVDPGGNELAVWSDH